MPFDNKMVDSFNKILNGFLINRLYLLLKFMKIKLILYEY